jgi:nucleotide-binding universal stress UspA family protein
MPWLTRILCPIDLNVDSTDTLWVTRELAEKYNASVSLLYVAAAPVTGPSEAIPDWQRSLSASLEKLEREWFEGRAPCQILIWSGDPAAAILQAAHDLDADLIVMATHGRKGIDRLILGSVAERVVRESPKPVLTVKPRMP